MAADGWSNLYGCDPFIKEDIFYENGVRIYKKTIHEMSGAYDWIIFNDSLEHVTDPHEVMESAGRILSENGKMRIQLPVFPNIAFDMFGTAWFQLDAPRHIFIPSLKSVNYLADKHGFKITDIKFNSSNAQIIRSFLWSKGIPFCEQTPEVIYSYFSSDEIDQINGTVCEVNKNGYGDHAIFYLERR